MKEVDIMKFKVLIVIMFIASAVNLYVYPADEILPPAERRISMDFKDASLKDVLKVFSMQSGLNFIAGEEVEDRKVTLYMEDVPVSDALNTILKANNLTYEQPPGTNIFIVKELKVPEVETITRIYQLNYADAEEVKELFEKMSEAKQIEEETPEGRKVTRRFIQGILSEYGKVAADKRTNSLIITDIPTQFPMIEEAIVKLDQPTPQVMIEAEVLEVASTLLEKIGVEFGPSFASFTGAVKTTAFPFSHLPEGADKAEGAIYGTISAQELTALLNLLRSDSRTKLLARPRILTLNNQTAEIKITAQTAVAKITEIESLEAVALQTTRPERVETGVTLLVTPVINKDGYVTMTVEPKVTEPRASRFFPGVFVDPHTRSARATIRVKDGDTIVMGGLISTSTNEIERRVPFLSDLPLIGAAFRSTEKEDESKELIIFITPHIVRDDYYKIVGGAQGLERESPSEGSDRELIIEEALRRCK